MFIASLFENYITEAGANLVVLYPGRFQPFHLGHREVFQSLQGKFGRDSVYIATSNKTELPKSPFNFSDKSILMHAAGIPGDRILEVASPYKLPAQFDAANTIFIAAIGAPDVQRLSPDSIKKDGTEGYFKTFKSIKECATADKHGYVIVAEERHKVINIAGQQIDVSHGTQTREAWNLVRDNPKQRSEFLLQMYGRDDAELGRVLDKIARPVTEEAAGVGVVKNGNDPRYSMATMGNDNDVTAATLPKMMKGYRLTERYNKLQEEIASLKEKWSTKYKKSINCNNPKGFSQRAHCQGRKK